MKKLFKMFNPVASVLGAFSIVIISRASYNNHYDFVVLTLMFMHTALSIKEYKDIISENWKVLVYAYALISFILFKNLTLLLMLNIVQSCETLYELSGQQEREANVNNTKA